MTVQPLEVCIKGPAAVLLLSRLGDDLSGDLKKRMKSKTGQVSLDTCPVFDFLNAAAELQRG